MFAIHNRKIQVRVLGGVPLLFLRFYIMPNLTYLPIPANNITTIQKLHGGDVFVFYEQDVDVIELINNGCLYMLAKDSHKNGSAKVISLSNGFIFSRDSDRKVVKLSCEIKVSILSTKI